MAGLTDKLAANMAACKREIISTAQAIKRQTPEIDARHDEAAAEVGNLDAQLAKDPGNEKLSRQRDEYDRVRSGLYAASEYGEGLVRQMVENG